MEKKTAVILFGVIIFLFLASIAVGQMVFPVAEREILQLNQTQQLDSAGRKVEGTYDKSSRMRNVRLAFSSFDLLGGLTNDEIINIGTMDKSLHIFYLLSCVLLIIGLRKP